MAPSHLDQTLVAKATLQEFKFLERCECFIKNA